MSSFALSTSTVVSYIYCQVFQIFGLMLIVPSTLSLIQWKFDSSYLKIIYFIYCGWLLTVIFRGIVFDYNSLKFMLFDADFGLLRYFVPLILLFPNLRYYKKIFKVIIVLRFFISPLRCEHHFHVDNLMDLNYENTGTKFTFEYFTKILSIPSGFLMLTYVYHSNRVKLFALLVILISANISIIRARRGLLFMSLSPIIVGSTPFLFFFR